MRDLPAAPEVRLARPPDVEGLAALGVPGMATAADWRAELARPGARVWWAGGGAGPEGARPEGALVARRAADRVEIHQLWVAPGRRRRGVAGRLVARALEEARALGAAEVHLEVRISNRAAIRCYGKHGFVAVGRRPRYYPGAPREDALSMTRVLSP